LRQKNVDLKTLHDPRSQLDFIIKIMIKFALGLDQSDDCKTIYILFDYILFSINLIVVVDFEDDEDFAFACILRSFGNLNHPLSNSVKITWRYQLHYTFHSFKHSLKKEIDYTTTRFAGKKKLFEHFLVQFPRFQNHDYYADEQFILCPVRFLIVVAMLTVV
jgi:hypothetical protein